MVKISIITVCYNAELNIEKTILSVLNQIVPVYEYIIIDGGSTDNTMKIVKSYIEKFLALGVSYIYQSQKDEGISDAFNKGIAISTGELIGLINADDELLKNTSQILQRIYTKDIDIYYGNCIWVDKINNLEFISKPKIQIPCHLGILLYEMVMIHPSTFITLKAYRKVGGYNIQYKYCMDQELLYRMYCAGVKFSYVDKELTIFQAGGISDTNPIKVFNEASRIAISSGEPVWKVKGIKLKKICRDFLARKAKKYGLYNILKNKKIFFK